MSDLNQFQRPPRFTDIKNELSGTKRFLLQLAVFVVMTLVTWLFIYQTMDEIYAMFIAKDWKMAGGAYLAFLINWFAMICAGYTWLVKD